MRVCKKCGSEVTGRCATCRNAQRRRRYANLDEEQKTKSLLSQRNWRKRNIETCRKKGRMYAKQKSEAARVRGAAFRSARSVEIAEKKRIEHQRNPQITRNRVAEWRLKNREKHRAKNHKRRARLRGAAGWHYTTHVHISWRWEMWGGKCWVCNCKAEATDHVIPLASGGSHWPSNLRPICSTCNSKRKKSRQKPFTATR